MKLVSKWMEVMCSPGALSAVFGSLASHYRQKFLPQCKTSVDVVLLTEALSQLLPYGTGIEMHRAALSMVQPEEMEDEGDLDDFGRLLPEVVGSALLEDTSDDEGLDDFELDDVRSTADRLAGVRRQTEYRPLVPVDLDAERRKQEAGQAAAALPIQEQNLQLARTLVEADNKDKPSVPDSTATLSAAA